MNSSYLNEKLEKQEDPIEKIQRITLNNQIDPYCLKHSKLSKTSIGILENSEEGKSIKTPVSVLDSKSQSAEIRLNRVRVRDRKGLKMESRSRLEPNAPKRFRKSKDHLRLLEIEFKKDQDWSKEKILKLAKFLNLKPGQIYKWHWDRKFSYDKKIHKRIERDDIPFKLF
mmetsp:Transcript_12339/g.8985  ORF Transcript_12339/g.8985 Transcript_12339/m.8985 type:complete len:170 (+) Transcript_12339:472-981(+)